MKKKNWIEQNRKEVDQEIQKGLKSIFLTTYLLKLKEVDHEIQ